MPTSQHRKPPSPKSAHLPANTAKTAAKTLPLATPIQPHHPPNALLELAEMRGNEREIDLFRPFITQLQVGTREGGLQLTRIAWYAIIPLSHNHYIYMP